MMMLVHCCPTQGQLSPTWQSYAGLPPEEEAYVTFYTLESLERGDMVEGDFSTALRSK